MKQKVKSTFGRKVMKLVCVLLGLVLAGMLGVTAAMQYLTQRVNFVQSGDLSAFVLQEMEGTHLNPEDYGGHRIIGGKGSHIVNILLIGQDRLEGEERARSDSMILCTFNKQTKQITMTSFLRDLYVKIPGHGKNRINAAYSFGGMPLLEQTIRENFGIHVDGNVEVDFAQFAGLVDLLEGVEIELRADEAALISRETGTEVGEGLQKLNGDQALAYARIRKLDADGDFARTNRQRKVLSALMDTYKSASLPTILSMVDNVLPMITTDLNGLEILRYAVELFPLISGGELISQRIPADGSYEGRKIDGMSVLVPDMDAARQTLAETLLGG